MNQEKIGKLIAKLRKEKGLTQSELGEMVGVGYRAVSKWETGVTLPDISIINELSTILGISSDELLNGEINHKNNEINPAKTSTKKSTRVKLVIILCVCVLAIIASYSIFKSKNANDEQKYVFQSLDPEEYLVEGLVTYKENKMSIKIDKIEFQDYRFYQQVISDYEYKLILNGEIIFGFGGSGEYEYQEDNISIKEFLESFTICYDDKLKGTLQEEGLLTINFVFIDTANNKINKNIKTKLIKKKNNEE